MFNKKDLINTLDEIADLFEFNGENAFKVNAFRNGSNIIRRLNVDIEHLIKSKEIENLKGIGKALQSVIYDFFLDGKSKLLDDLKSQLPESLFDIFSIRGLGPKKISVLYKDLEIKSIGELEYACNENRLVLLKGFGKLTQQKIVQEIERIKVNNKFVLLNYAEKIFNEINQTIKTFNSILEFQVSGDYRRNMEIISQLEFVIQINSKENFLTELKNKFADFKLVNNEIHIEKYWQIPVHFHLTDNKIEFTNSLFFNTGSSEFLSKLDLPNSFSEDDELKIFRNLKMDYIAPEMRELGYFNISNKASSNLELKNIVGFFHFHTNYSDGSNSLIDMINAAQNLGYKYFTVCDHSKSAVYANGLSESRILLQKEEIEKLKAEFSLNIFHGIESDILKDGSLDYSDEILNSFDFIVASVHSNFSMSENEMTNRIIKAVENPATDVLGHPTGRLLLSRESYKINIKKIIDACSQNGVAIEINSNPHRLDLDWRNIYYAREMNCLFSINADAHSVDDIKLSKYGVMIARKAGIQANEVINCFSLNEFKKFIRRKINGLV